MLPSSVDVVVVGAGNAAFSAALAAAESGVSVLMLERAPEDEAGGNSRFTAGAMRCVYDGVDDLKALMPDLTEEEISNTDFGKYTEDMFFDDIGRVTEYRADLRPSGFQGRWQIQILGRPDRRELGRRARTDRSVDRDRAQERRHSRLPGARA